MNTAKLITVGALLIQHPEFKHRDANHAISWADTKENTYLINPADVDEHGWCTVFYHQYTGRKKFPEHPLVGLELARRADKIEEVEPKLYRLMFS